MDIRYNYVNDPKYAEPCPVTDVTYEHNGELCGARVRNHISEERVKMFLASRRRNSITQIVS